VNGRALSRAVQDQEDPSITSDGAHGAIVAWEDFRDLTFHIFAQRVLGSGAIAPGWPTDGRQMSAAPIGQNEPILVSDGASGAIVTWTDFRNGGNSAQFAQHVLGSGAIDAAWPVNGTELSRSTADQTNASITTDGASGAIIAWEEDSFIVAQHIRASGVLDPAFPVNGRLVRPVLTFQHDPDLLADGAGNAIVAWSDRASNAPSDIYAMQVRAADTVTVCEGTPADLPAEVDNGVRVSRSGTDATIAWNLAANATSSDVLRGRVRGLPVGGLGERCLVHNTVARTLTDPDLPGAGDSFWYLIRGEKPMRRRPVRLRKPARSGGTARERDVPVGEGSPTCLPRAVDAAQESAQMSGQRDQADADQLHGDAVDPAGAGATAGPDGASTRRARSSRSTRRRGSSAGEASRVASAPPAGAATP
jgi:hypothetical protein